MGGFFGNFILKQVGSGSGMPKTRTRPEPASSFFKKTQTRLYYLSGRVKSDPLGSDRIGYPRIGLLLPSLDPTALAVKLES